MKPSISIVTICFNNLPELIETCKSVDKQTIKPDEHLVIDGSINEEIVSWLLQTPQPAYRRWMHERDKGISDAFNKGIINSKSEIIHLLNSGDKYVNEKSIEKVLDSFERDSNIMWTHAKYIQHRGEIDVISGLPFEKDTLWKGMRTVAHPTMFIKKDIYNKYGLYNTSYRVGMDYDMLIRIRNEKFEFIPSPLIYFAPGGASQSQFRTGLKEVREIYQKNIGYSFKQTLWQFRQQLLHMFMQTGLGKRWFRQKNKKNKA